jgi:hypothetical protein
MSRIPLELQAVFLASNQGEEVHKPPSNRSAFKLFQNLFGGFGRRKRTKRPNLKRLVSQSSFDTVGTVVNEDLSADTPSDQEVESVPTSPHEFLESILKSRGYCTKQYPVLQSAFFNQPTPLQLASYDVKLIDLLKRQDEEKIREILSCGVSANACNIHGESLMHKACRMGFHRILQIFIDFGGEIKISDAQGRTLLHDTCWGARPSFQAFSLLIQREPSLLFMADCRGVCPLDYVRKDHYIFWIDYLECIVDKYWPPVQSAPLPPAGIHQAAHSRPMPDPENALPLDVASMVASGRLTPKEALFLAADNIEDDDSCSCSSDDEGSSDDNSDSESDDDSFSDDDENSLIDEMEEKELLADLVSMQKYCVIPV